MSSLYILYLYFHCCYVIQTSYFCKYCKLIVFIIDKQSKGWWLKRFLQFKFITVENVSRVNILQLLECCIINQMMSFNGIMNVNFDEECFEVIIQFSRKNIKSFSKGPFLSHFLYFSISLQIIHRISNINNFLLSFGVFVLIFQYLTFC